MYTQAELSLYPLRTSSIADPIDQFIDELATPGVEVEPGRMSTIISGDHTEVFRALSEGYARAAEKSHVVLVVKLSNACPARGKGPLPGSAPSDARAA